MSSSASQNDKNQIVRYKGRVLHTQNFSALCASDLELKKVSDAFTQYWKTGYHPSLGKDAAFARPTEMLKLNVRHTHVDNQDYIPEDSDKNTLVKNHLGMHGKNSVCASKMHTNK